MHIEMRESQRFSSSLGGSVGAEENKKAEGCDEKLKTFMNSIDDKIIETLPDSNAIDSKDLKSTGWAGILALANLSIYVTILLYLMITGTISEFNRHFLALSEKSDSICKSIPVAITGSFESDWKGSWNTKSSYLPGRSIYDLTMTGTTVNNQQYTNIMQMFSSRVEKVGEVLSSSDVITAQIAWSIFQTNDNENSMQFRMNAQLNGIFTGMTSIFPTLLSSKEGVCQFFPLPIATYDDSTMILTAAFPASAPSSSESTWQPTPQPTFAPTGEPGPPYAFCPDQINARNDTLGLLYRHAVDIDMRSVVAAFAVNFGIVDKSALICTSIGTIGIVYETCIDRTLPSMIPITCTSSSSQGDSVTVCFAPNSDGSTLLYPVLTTSDIVETQFAACKCPRDAKSANCNQVEFIQLALVFSKTRSMDDTIAMGFKLQRMIASSGANSVKDLVSGLGYAAAALHPSGFPYLYDNWKSGGDILKGKTLTYAEFSAGFVSLGKDMSIMSFMLLYDGNRAVLNSNGLTLADFSTSNADPLSAALSAGTKYAPPAIMCMDSLYYADALQLMAVDPPVSVTQPYFSCHPTLISAVITAAGISSANAALVSSIFLGASFFLLVCCVNSKGEGAKILPPAKKLVLAEEKLEELSAKYQVVINKLADLEALVLQNCEEKRGLGRLNPQLSIAKAAFPPQAAYKYSAPSDGLSATPSTVESSGSPLHPTSIGIPVD